MGRVAAGTRDGKGGVRAHDGPWDLVAFTIREGALGASAVPLERIGPS
jgi:hypothetical protein